MPGNCSICLGSSSDENADKSPFASIPCGHVFHFACITQWLKVSKECPECRAPCSTRKIVRLYLKIASKSPTKSKDSAQIEQLQKKVRQKTRGLKLIQLELNTLKKAHGDLHIECDDLQEDLLQLEAENKQIKSDCDAWKMKAHR